MPDTTDSILNCTRCGAEAERLYDYDHKNDDDEIIHDKLCWDCDWDLMNGGDMDESAGDIYQRRAENAYEYDPINVPRPY